MKIAAFPVFFGGHIHTVAAVMKIAGHELLNMTPRKGRQEYAVALREANWLQSLVRMLFPDIEPLKIEWLNWIELVHSTVFRCL